MPGAPERGARGHRYSEPDDEITR
jgi:hypothetical protein